MSVVIIINKKLLKSPRVMTLVSKLVLTGLDYNILLKAEHIYGHLNCLADSLSRSNIQKFNSLNEEVNCLINMSMASGTWKTYKTAVDSLANFRKIYKMNPIWPVPVEILAQFIAYLSYKGLTASTVSTYISGLSHVHKMNGLHDSTKFFLISKMLEDMKRKNPQQSDIRASKSIGLLKRLIKSLQHIRSSHYEAYMLSAAFSLAYFGILRVSEISLKNSSDESGHALKFNDVSFENNEKTLCVKICSSKTDQKNESVTLIIQTQSDIDICPVILKNRIFRSRRFEQTLCSF